MNKIALPDAPYKGLVPYSEEDAHFFFGRDVDRDLVTANILGARLTLLYGASGVGKTSLLQAGLVHHLRRLARQNLKEHGAPELAVGAFSAWQRDPLPGLVGVAAAAVQEAWGGREVEPIPEGLDLAEALHAWTERLGGVLLILLDQFEEYFVYQPDFGESRCDSELARAINAQDLRVGFLISLREDALARLDRFKGKIPGLFINYLRLEHLDREEGRAAIEKPLAEWSRRLGLASDQVYRAEPDLVEEILKQVAVGKVTVGQSGTGPATQILSRTGRIETPYLQLVLSRLWEEEARLTSRLLRKATLMEVLGGAEKIVQTHLDSALSSLSDDERETAAGTLKYLVTPGGAKVSLAASDLAEYTELPLDRIEPVLRRLSAPAVRVLRLAAGPEGEARYEIFHDVLVPAVLDWRRRFERDKENAEAQERLARETRKARRLLVGVVGLGALLVGLLLFGIWAFRQYERAEEQQRVATARGLAVHAFSLPDEQLDLSLLLSVQAQKIFDDAESQHTLRSSLQRASGLIAFLGRFDGPVLSTACSPDGKMVVAAAADGTVRIWSIGERRPLASPLQVNRKRISNLSFSHDGKILAVVEEDGSMRLWSIADRLPLGDSFLIHKGSALTLAISPDGQTLASGWGDGTVHLWSIAFRRPIGQPLKAHSGSVQSLSFSPDGRILASGGLDGAVRLWSVESSGPVGGPLLESGAAVGSVAFSPEGRILASGDTNGKVHLWSVLDHRLLEEPPHGHEGAVWSISFSPDRQTLAAGAEDGTMRVWSISRGYLREPLRGHGHRVLTISFTPDGKTLVSGGEDGTVRLWTVPAPAPQVAPISKERLLWLAGLASGSSPERTDLSRGLDDLSDRDPGTWRTRACQIANRNLSLSEWEQYLGQEIPYQLTCPDLAPAAEVPARQ